jgi:hypothetical protein
MLKKIKVELIIIYDEEDYITSNYTGDAKDQIEDNLLHFADGYLGSVEDIKIKEIS